MVADTEAGAGLRLRSCSYVSWRSQLHDHVRLEERSITWAAAAASMRRTELVGSLGGTASSGSCFRRCSEGGAAEAASTAVTSGVGGRREREGALEDGLAGRPLRAGSER
jgi:hypothetical protein